MLNSLYLRENSKYTLMDEIMKIHKHFYEKNIEYHKIDEFGMDDFMIHENLDFNEYEIKNLHGKQISEFSAKFSAFNFSAEEKSIMIVINDISERARLRESKISEMLKTIMLWSISHELRTPVNQINGALTLILPTLATSEQRNLIRIANSSTELLKSKVDDMLDFYEVETGNFKSELIKFHPKLLLDHLRSIFSPITDKNSIKLHFYLHENTPDTIVHDLPRIKQILINLISNAVKYTKKGIISIVIDWKNAKRDLTMGNIQFSVSDSGWGISKEKRENLFEFLSPESIKNINFSDNFEWNTTKLAGTGLGISQKIAIGLGSKINYTSIVGVGSRFWICLNAKGYNKFIDERANRLIRCKTMDKDSLAILQKKNFTYSKYSIMSKLKHYSLERWKSDPKINFILVDNNSVNSRIDFLCFNNEMSSNQNYERYDPRSTKSISKIQSNKNKSKKLTNNNSNEHINFEKVFEDFPIPSNESISPVRDIPSFINRAADLTGKGFIKYPTLSNLKDVTANQINFTVPMNSNKTWRSSNQVSRIYEETKRTKDSELVKNQKFWDDSNSKEEPIYDANLNHYFESREANLEEPSRNISHRKFWLSTADDSIYPSIRQDQINPIFKKPCGWPSVLIVDDQFINRFIIKQFCIKYNIQNQEAEDGMKALERIEVQSKKKWWNGFELVLMDLNMPILGGVEASRNIMEQKKKGTINEGMKIVAVTAFPSKTEKNKCASVGIWEFIVKPFTITHFINLIKDK